MNLDQIAGICGNDIPNKLGIDFSVAPELLYYAYIPVIIGALIFGILFSKDDTQKKYSLLLPFITTFILWTAIETLQWIASYHASILEAWQMALMSNVLLYSMGGLLSTQIFFQENKRKMFIAMLPILLTSIAFALVSHNPVNIASYDFQNCEGIEGPLWNILYLYQSAIIVYISLLAALKIRQKSEQKNDQIFLGGLVLFLFVFFISTFIGDYTNLYEVNMIGPIGMVGFLVTIGILWSKYNLLEKRILPSEIGMYALGFFIASLFFIQDIQMRNIFLALTLLPLYFTAHFVITASREDIKKNKELIELNQEKDDMLSFVSHQLRTPLTSIKWGLEAIVDAIKPVPNTEPVQHVADELTTATTDLINTVNAFLDISHIEKGNMKMEFAPVPLGGFVGRIAHEFDIAAEKKSLHLNHIDKLDPRFTLIADATKLRQVIVNTIDNAIKYTTTGSVTVTTAATATTATITITDTGHGIDPAEQDKLFKKFSRGSASQSTHTGGSGIGLYLVKKIIELHNGTITLSSPGIDKGSTCTITLPLVQPIISTPNSTDDIK